MQFTCPSCGTVYRVESHLIGDVGRIACCVTCNHRFAIRVPVGVVPPAAPLPEDIEEEKPLFLEIPEEAVVEEAEVTEEVDIESTPVVQAGPPSDVELPDSPSKPVGLAVLSDGGNDEESSLDTRRRWRDPMRAEKRKATIFGPSTEAAQPTSGILYKLIIVAVGAAAFLTSFLGLGEWQIDPIWSLTIIVLGLLSFGMQSLSGLLVAGLFCFFYPMAVFSQQVPAIVAGELTGVIIIGAQTAFAAALLIIYGVLMARKSALFVLREGSGQSVVALVIGVLTLLIVTWANLDSSFIPSLGSLAPLGRDLNSYTYYSLSAEFGVPLTVLLQACVLSLAIAFGFSARAVRNRMLLLASVGLALGFLALLFLYAPLVVGPISLSFP